MKYAMTTATLSAIHLAVLGGLAATALPSPAQAQRTSGVCPSGTHKVVGVNGTERCSENSKTYTTPTSFASTSGTLQKADKADRCPTGWNTNGAGMECITQYQEMPSLSRAKNGKPCKPNEVDEWGVWCTSNYEKMTMEVMRGAAMRDYNKMYAVNRGVVATFSGAELDDKLMTPAARKVFGDKWPDQKTSASSSEAPTMAKADEGTKSCDTAQAKGKAVGNMLGGARGAALGGMIGAGIGHKKTGC